MRFSILTTKLTDLLKTSRILRSFLLLLIVSGISYFLISQTSKIIQNFSSTITYGLVGQPKKINPLWSALNLTDETLTKLVYRSLIKFDLEGHPVGDLAEKWGISEDEKVYTIFLKPNQTWQDNQPISIDDVVFTFQLTQKEDYQGPEKQRFQHVQIEATDNLTLKFTLQEPFSPFLESLNLPILPKHTGVPLNLKPVGSTSFQIKKFAHQLTPLGEISQLTLENKSFSATKDTPRRIIIRFYQNEQELNHAFKLGEVDTILTNNPELPKKLTNWPNVVQKVYPICGQTLTLFYNLTRDKNFPTQKTSFKNAIFAALIQSAFGIQPLISPISPSHWAYYSPTETIKMDDAEIQQSFKSLDLENPLTFVSLDDQPTQTIGQNVFSVLSEYGLELDLKIVSVEQLKNEILPERKFDLLLARQKFGQDPDQYDFWHSSQTDLQNGGLNVSGYINRQVDKAVEDARNTIDEQERKEAYITLQKRLSADQPALFFTHPRLYEIAKINKQLFTGKEKECLWHETDYFYQIFTPVLKTPD